MNLFPLFSAAVAERDPLPLYRDVLWDTEHNTPVFRDGDPVMVTGLPALQGWILRALSTKRFRHGMHSWGFGSALDELAGKTYSPDLIRSEGARYVRECLMRNPYITDVAVKSWSFAGDVLTMEVQVATIYGEVMSYV